LVSSIAIGCGNCNSTRSLRGGWGGRSAPAPHPGQGIHFISHPPQLLWRWSPTSIGGFSAGAFMFYRGGQATLKPEPHQPCPQSGGCLIVKATHRGNSLELCPPGFRHQPVLSGVLTAASVSTRVDPRYQTENRRRQRHRVRQAVFVQLVCVCPQAFRNVVRSGK